VFKHIAVGLDGSPHAAAAEEIALAFASHFGAVVHGVHVIDATFLEGAFITDISGAMGFEPFVNLQPQVLSTLEDLAATVRERFDERCRAAGAHGVFHLERAAVVQGMLGAARMADLLVVGQRGVSSRLHMDSLGRVAGALLRRSPVPVLVCPESPVLPRRPLLAYDGSPKAVRALHVAAELCRSLALPLLVMTVDEDAGRARARLDEAASYLAPFGIEAELRREPGEAVEQVLLGQLEPGDLDLLCLGAHGHRRVVELVLGSTTEYLARRSPVPLLCITRA
jgi:nucleotide-binding universal stress UspA family protein